MRLSPAALEVLFDAADVLTEGQVDHGRYFGSTMLTIDLPKAQRRLSEACDAPCARRVATLMNDDDRVRARARKVALDQASRTAGTMTTPVIDLHAVHRPPAPPPPPPLPRPPPLPPAAPPLPDARARVRLDLDVEGAAPHPLRRPILLGTGSH